MAKGIALTIGLNAVDPKHYEGWSGELVACEADARSMAGIARRQRFTTSMLLTKRATRRAVLGAIGRAAKSLRGGDIFLVTYSGHGGQIPDRNGDEPDMEDETWCLYDGELLDDELFDAWTTFAPGVRILVTSDSCHSGSVTRAAYAALAATVTRAMTDGSAAGSDSPPRYRAMPQEVAVRTYYAHRKFYDDIGTRVDKDAVKHIKATVMLISGCHDNQLSSDGDFNGLFTARLLQVWNDGNFARDYRAFHRAIVKKMPPIQVPEYSVIGTPSPGFEAQKPFTLETPGARIPSLSRAAGRKAPKRQRGRFVEEPREISPQVEASPR
jgi:hypothetical protein